MGVSSEGELESKVAESKAALEELQNNFQQLESKVDVQIKSLSDTGVERDGSRQLARLPPEIKAALEQLQNNFQQLESKVDGQIKSLSTSWTTSVGQSVKELHSKFQQLESKVDRQINSLSTTSAERAGSRQLAG